MSFLKMDDRDCIDGLIGINELNNVSLLREVFIDADLESAGNYHGLRAEIEIPNKAALAYRDVIRDGVRCRVLEFRGFRHDDLIEMAIRTGIPESDRDGVAACIRERLAGLHGAEL
ncbi:MAG: hypothetical protein OXC91_05955 [Rhodobacteraceae bacterium]|nr:hypothetical protein [Paracoccaceae bacterium]